MNLLDLETGSQKKNEEERKNGKEMGRGEGEAQLLSATDLVVGVDFGNCLPSGF